MRGSSLLLASLGGAVAVHATSCEANNCLRAVRATARLPRASADCSSFLRSTFTPTTVTYTDYTTVSELAYATQLATRVDTVFVTSTVVNSKTLTISVPGSTKTETSYNPALKKRQVSTIPLYASPCSGAPQYTSACSCIGITGPIVITAPTPSTTITLPTTVTYSTQTDVVTVETKSTTITDATVTVATTAKTETVTGPSATTTLTVPYPPLCKNIVLYNGLRPQIFGNYLETNLGAGVPTAECCLRCYLFPDCVAYVTQPSRCLLLRENHPPSLPTSPMCPSGIKNTVFGTAGSGVVGKGPCQNTVPG